MFDFKSGEIAVVLRGFYTPFSSVIFDFLSAQQVENAKHKNQTTTLNSLELNVFSQRPALVDQHFGLERSERFRPQVFMLKEHSIILRINSLNKD